MTVFRRLCLGAWPLSSWLPELLWVSPSLTLDSLEMWSLVSGHWWAEHLSVESVLRAWSVVSPTVASIAIASMSHKENWKRFQLL